ncbi:G-protein coupled receptor [Branchiostoma belcheri]|nr:G-protein coupled receptor [Branchiostoma belcheri]
MIRLDTRLLYWGGRALQSSSHTSDAERGGTITRVQGDFEVVKTMALTKGRWSVVNLTDQVLPTDEAAYTSSGLSPTPLLIEPTGADTNVTNTTHPTVPTFSDHHLMKVIITSFLFLWAAAGNVSVLAVMQRSRSRSRTPLHSLVFQLTVADSLVTFVTMPSELAWAATVSWKAGEAMCRIIKFLQVLAMGTLSPPAFLKDLPVLISPSTKAQRRGACSDMSRVRLGIEPGSPGSQSNDLPRRHMEGMGWSAFSMALSSFTGASSRRSLMSMIGLYQSTLITVAISVDRAVAVLFPFSKSGAPHRTKVMIITCWVLSTVFSFPQGTRSVACEDSNPGPLGSESSTLPLRHTTPLGAHF